MAGYKTYTPGQYTQSEELKKLNEQAAYWNNQQLKDFTFRDFDYSDRTKGIQTDLANLGDFAFSKQQNWDANLAKLENMKDPSYDLNGDALYQQYKDQYTTQGKMAMMDTMGQAAAMTGGYGNSYAQSVGQQAYQGYLSQLNDVVPQLYQLALSKYNSDRDNLYQMNDLYQGLYNTEYGTYADKRDYLTESMYQSEASDRDLYNMEYQKAYDENNSYNTNVTSNRSNFNSLSSDLATREWSQYTDQEAIAQAAIDMYNTNAYRNEQLNYDALRQQYENQYAGYINPDDVDYDPVTGKITGIAGYEIANGNSVVGTVSNFRTTSGDNFKVTVNGQSYNVENEGKVTDESVKNALGKYDAMDGSVIVHGDTIYVKNSNEYYKVGAREFFGNSTAGYGNLLNAIKNPTKKE